MRFFERIQRLEEIASDDPKRFGFEADLRPLLQELPSAIRFYSLIATADWVPILEGGGCFSETPDDMVGFTVEEPEERAVLERIRLQLLARLAEKAPSDIQRVFAGLPSPDDHTVRQHYVQVVVNLLRASMDGLEQTILDEITWLRGVRYIDAQLARQYSDLTYVLADRDDVMATDVANAILLPVPAAETEDAAWWQHSLGFRLKSWEYKQTLDSITEKLVDAQPTGGLQWVCGTLSSVLERLPGKPSEVDTTVLLWRPAIENNEQNAPNDVLSWLIEAVRDTGKNLVPELGDTVLKALQEPRYDTFRRIALHLREIHPDLDRIGTEALSCDPAVLKDVVLRHELFHLLESSFDRFSRHAQGSYFSFIDGLGTREEMYRYLWPVRMYLQEDRAASYRQYSEEFGALQHPDFASYHETVWVGPTSPFGVSEMQNMDIPALVERLNAWEYKGGLDAPEPEGLARELAAFAAQDAVRVSEHAASFEDLLQPTCVRGIVQGLADAVKNGQSISWERVLHLCEWAVEQERGDEPEGSGLEEFDRTWGWARKQIAWLLRRGTEQSDAEIPFEFKDSVWSILRELIVDPDPTAEHEADRAQYEDPSTTAINTVRGVALGAVFSFALWVARHDPQENRTWLSFGLSEVQSALEDRLANDQSPAVRSLFGKWLPFLFGLDQEWTTSNIGMMLPLDESKSPLWTAPWDAYLMFCSILYVEFLDLLRSSYERALDALGTERREKTRIADPDERFGHHLVLFYREGVLAPEDPLFTTFFEKADTKLRYSVMADAVRLVQDIADEKRGPAISRLQDLWERRCRAAIGEEADEYHELSSFGWWFLKDDFPPDWRLRQLLETQRNSIGLELDGRVLEKMIDLSEEYLPLVLDCLEVIVRNPAGGDWRMYDDHVREILRRGFDSDLQALHDQAENLVHYIGSLGFLSFRELLE